MLTGDDGLAAVREAEEVARRHRVDGVPFFVLNGRVALSGARPAAGHPVPFSFLDLRLRDDAVEGSLVVHVTRAPGYAQW